jgi:hypothetical protein
VQHLERHRLPRNPLGRRKHRAIAAPANQVADLIVARNDLARLPRQIALFRIRGPVRAAPRIHLRDKPTLHDKRTLRGWRPRRRWPIAKGPGERDHGGVISQSGLHRGKSNRS